MNKKQRKNQIFLWIIFTFSVIFLSCGCHSNGTREATTEVPEKISRYSKGFTEDGYFDGVNAQGLVTLCDYKNLSIDKENVEVTEDELQEEIDAILQSYGDSKMTDDFVKEHYQDQGITTVKDLKKSLRENLQSEKAGDAIWDTLLVNCTFRPIPEKVMDLRLKLALEVLLDEYHSYMDYDDQQIMEMYGVSSMDELKEGLRPDTEKTIKIYLLAQAIAKEENLTVDTQAIETYVGDENVEAYYAEYGKPYVHAQILVSLVSDYLKENLIVK